jgi:erythromycin esterase-like protein
VAAGNYQDAADMIGAFIEVKKVYPAFAERVEAQANHAKELVNAVRAKRNFPNLSALSMSKQQEILDHAVEHFDELRLTLKHIENVLKDEAIQDIRSTVWVVRTSVYTLVAIVAAAFVTEFSGALGKPLWVVFNDLADNGYKFLMKFIPFL